MTGSFRLHRNGSLEDDPYRRAVVRLDDGSDVTYRDVRRFGTWTLLEDGELEPTSGQRLGPEPLERGYSRRAGSGVPCEGGERRSSRLCSTSERSPVSGTSTRTKRCGARASIRCGPPAAWTRPTVGRLHRCAARRAPQRDRHGREPRCATTATRPAQTGSMQDEFKVYGRRGEPCRRCRGTIERLVVG